jgi:hypothetical protein
MMVICACIFSWNQLVVSIVVMSIIGIGLEEIEGQVCLDCVVFFGNDYSPGVPYQPNHHSCDEGPPYCKGSQVTQDGKRYPIIAQHCYADSAPGNLIQTNYYLPWSQVGNLGLLFFLCSSSLLLLGWKCLDN